MSNYTKITDKDNKVVIIDDSINDYRDFVDCNTRSIEDYNIQCELQNEEMRQLRLDDLEEIRLYELKIKEMDNAIENYIDQYDFNNK